MKPFVLFKGEGKLSKKLLVEMDAAGIPYGFNTKGYSNATTSYAYLRYFKKIVTDQVPHTKEHLLFLDNFGSQWRNTFINLALDLDIYPLYFPPNCTHLVQPVDHRIAAWLKQFIGELYKVEQQLFSDEWTQYHETKSLSDVRFFSGCQ